MEPTKNFDRTNLDFIWDPTESPTAAMRFKHTLHNNFNQTCFIDQMVNNSFLNRIGLNTVYLLSEKDLGYILINEINSTITSLQNISSNSYLLSSASPELA